MSVLVSCAMAVQCRTYTDRIPNHPMSVKLVPRYHGTVRQTRQARHALYVPPMSSKQTPPAQQPTDPSPLRHQPNSLLTKTTQHTSHSRHTIFKTPPHHLQHRNGNPPLLARPAAASPALDACRATTRTHGNRTIYLVAAISPSFSTC
jgi:hypothetical protein